jgi:hypothetical protein
MTQIPNLRGLGVGALAVFPLTKCIVTDEAFEHGKPSTFVHNGQEIKLCCKDCLADFKKEPAKYLSKLNAAKRGGMHGHSPPPSGARFSRIKCNPARSAASAWVNERH